MDMSLLQTKMKPATPLPELQTVEDIYRWIDENIAYGWQDKDGGTHTSEMKDFRRLYRTMSVTETLDAIGIPNQMYCCRIFEPDDYGNLEEEEHMHCFLLYFQNGKTYHMEHPNVEQKGIYEYPTEEDALRTITEYYVKLRGGKESPFREFNAFINHLA